MVKLWLTDNLIIELSELDGIGRISRLSCFCVTGKVTDVFNVVESFGEITCKYKYWY